MNPTLSDKTMLWRSIAAFVFWCAFIVYLLFNSFHRMDYTGVLLFSLVALFDLFRIFLYLKFVRIRKSAIGVAEIAQAESRKGLILSILTNAEYLLMILLIAILCIWDSIPAYVTIPLALAALLCILPLYQSIRNLRRFDQQ